MNPEELPPFPLAPWELPFNSTEPLVAPATMRWRGELFGRETDWLVRMVPHNDRSGEIFICAEENGDEGNWWLGLVSLRGTKNDWLQGISHRLQHNKRVLQWRQVRIHDESGDWVVTSSAEALNHLHLLDSKRERANFKADWPFDFSRASAAQVHAEIGRAWNDENADLNFVRRWLLLSFDDQLTLMILWARGGEEEFRHAACLVLCSLGPRMSALPLRWSFFPESAMWLLEESPDGNEFEIIESGILQLWENALLKVFGLAWNDAILQQHPSACFHTALATRFRVTLDGPTFHEQLEAVCELHAWLDERASRGELDGATLARLRDTLR